MQDLSQDIIGTNPKYPPIVNHDWLMPTGYDNYPSDNNPVRIVPKLADLWNHNQKETGINLIPNLTLQHTGASQSTADDVVSPIIREAKKALMAGLKGKELADHLRARFATDHIVKAKDALAALSSEQGLLGNVYIDASAFSSAKEAEQFLTTHRTRLAQDIVLNEGKLNPAVIDLLASRFHKNVVASISYDENLFQKYRAHLQASGLIPRDFVIDSKETLRQAFLTEPNRQQPVKAKEEPKLDLDVVSQDLQARSDKVANFKRLAAEELLYRKVKPIIEFACKHMAEGKAGSDLKEMLRRKYASEDLNEAAKYLALVVSNSLNAETLDKLVSAEMIPEYVGEELKKFGKKYPVKHMVYEEKKSKPIGIQGFFYPLSGKKSSSEHCKESVEALRKGATIEAVKESLLTKVSAEEADAVLLEAVNQFNMAPAGVKANVAVKAKKEKVVADLEEKPTLPDPSTIASQTDEIVGFFEGAEMPVEIDSPRNMKSLEVGESFNRAGLDSAI
jgi:hypothetical protein